MSACGRWVGFASVLAFAFALPPSALGADFAAGARGTAGANFLKFGTGARALGMGGAAAAAVEDPSALYWNPAGLSRSPRAVSLMHARYLESIAYTDLALAWPLGAAGAKGVLGVEALYVDFGPIAGTDASGAAAGSYRPAASVLSAGFARGFHWRGRPLGFGVALRHVRFEIIDQASAIAADAGLRFEPSQRVTLAVTAQNLGKGTRFDETTDPLPLTLRLGSAWRAADTWLAALDVVAAKDDDPVLRAGVEHRLGVVGSGGLFLRLGYSSGLQDVGGLAGPSFGFGYQLAAFGFDYAFVPMGDLGMTHRAGLTFRWGAAPPAERTTP